jgi:hypothetical protein
MAGRSQHGILLDRQHMAGCDLEHMVGCDLAANRPFRWAVPALRPYRHIRKSGGVRYREFRARLLDKIAAGLANYIAGSSGEKSQGQFARIVQPGRTPFGQLFASSRPQLPDPPTKSLQEYRHHK